MERTPELQAAISVICALLDHAVYDAERNDECIAAVEAAHDFLRSHPNAATIAAMQEGAQ